MIRQIICIDEDKCNGCGLCAKACHEGAIGMVDGKAKLLRDDYCDGMGDCLPECPTGAISFEEREAAPYDEAAVQKNKQIKEMVANIGCPGSSSRMMNQGESQLRNWPVQIKLAPVSAPYFGGAKLLIAADCTAYAYANFHQDFINGRVTLVGCPKLDSIDYSQKLSAILANNDIQDVTMVRMQVPCCGGLEMATKKAIQASGKSIVLNVVTISIDGKII